MPTVFKYVTAGLFVAQFFGAAGDYDKLGDDFLYSLILRAILILACLFVFFAAFRSKSILTNHYQSISAGLFLYSAVLMSVFQYWSNSDSSAFYFYIGLTQMVIGFVAIFPVRSSLAYIVILGANLSYIIPHDFLLEARPAAMDIPLAAKINFIVLSAIIHHIILYFRISEYRERMLQVEKNELITRQKEKLSGLYENLQELNATKDKFFSIIAHDLKNPISSFRNMTEVVLKEYNEFNEEERLEIINLINDSAKFIQSLLENLLTWSRAQRGKIVYKPEYQDLGFIAKNNVSLLQVQAESKKLTLISEIPENTIAYIDANMITTVLRNLMSNAIKFTPQYGKVKVYAEEERDEYIITVEDNGVGIEPADLNKLFKLDTNRTTEGTNEEKGTGLGLILCKEFVDKHSGRIWAESEVGKGSKFRFTLPKKASPQEENNVNTTQLPS